MKNILTMFLVILGMALTTNTFAQEKTSTLILGVNKSDLNLEGKYTLDVSLGALTPSGYYVEAYIGKIINNQTADGFGFNAGYDVLQRKNSIITSLIPFVGVQYTNQTLHNNIQQNWLSPSYFGSPRKTSVSLNYGLLASIKVTDKFNIITGYGQQEGAKLGIGINFKEK